MPLLSLAVFGFSLGALPALATDGPDADAPADLPGDSKIAPDALSSMLEGHEVQKALAAEQARLEDLALGQLDSGATQKRLESQTAYEDQSDAEALDTAEAEHPELASAPAYDPTALPGDPEVERYLGEYAARVDISGQPGDAIVESMLPLLAENEAGEPAPVEHALSPEGQALEPENPLAGLVVPERLSDGIALPDIGVGIAPESVDPGAVGELLGDDAVTYANAFTDAADTDFILRVVPGGVEAAWQLRSQESPEALRLNLDLPDGAALEPDGEGGAIIARGDEELAHIPAPAAWDASGAAVPTELQIDGGALITSVDHRGGDWLYPLAADPEFLEDQVYWHSSTRSFTGWESYVYPAGQAFTNTRWEYHDWWGRGLYTDGYQGATYANQAQGTWVFHSPGSQARIYAGTFGLVRNLASSWDTYSQTHLMTGMYSYTLGGWDPGPGLGGASWASGSPQGPSPRIDSGDTDYWRDITHCLDPGPSYCDQYAGTPGNSMVFMTFVTPADTAWEPFTSYLGGAAIWIADEAPPVMGSPTHTKDGNAWNPASGWIKGAQLTAVTRAIDRGLGVKQFKLVVPGYAEQTRTHACVGHRDSRCPIDRMYRSHGETDPGAPTGGAFSYSSGSPMPQGVNTVQASAKDMLGQWSQPQTWNIKVDRSPPVLNLSGSLKQAVDAGGPLTQQTYQLTVNATDGSAASLSLQRSGVKRIEIYVDDQAQIFTPDQVCPTGNCSRATTFEFVSDDYSEGQHTVKVIAEDQLGHRSQQSLTFTTDHQFDPADNDEPLLNVQIGPPVPPSNNFEVAITATDAGGSGVEQLVVYVDGQVFQQFYVPCPGGGCSMTRTVTMGPAQSPAQHEIAVTAEDKAGNTVLDIQGRATTRPSRFGFSDNFDNRDPPPFDGGDPEPPGELSAGLIKAIEGRADVIRFPIDWCDIASNGIEGQPSTWEWGKFDPIFNQVWAYNTNGTATDDLDVVAMLVDSPDWAVNNPDSPACGNNPTEPPAPGHLDDWGMFVRGVLDRWGHPNFGITAVEAWNEPNLLKFWGVPPNTAPGTPNYNFPDPEHFASMVNVAFEQVGDYIEDWNLDPPTGQPHPNITMMPGGMAAQGYSRYDFLRRALTDDAAIPGPDFIVPAALQGLSVHLYANFAGKNRRAKEIIQQRFEENIDAFEDNQIAVPPVWITEIGFPSKFIQARSDKSSSEKTQRQRLLQAYMRYSRPPYDVHAFMAYRLIDEPNAPESQTQLFGVIGAHATGYDPKPAYCRLAEAARIPGSETAVPPGCSTGG